jgi:hypothetical protein
MLAHQGKAAFVSSDHYGGQLQTIVDILQGVGGSARVLGDGKARFVCVDHGTRGVELYPDDDGGFCVELFESEDSIRIDPRGTPELAAHHAIEWLFRDKHSS